MVNDFMEDVISDVNSYVDIVNAQDKEFKITNMNLNLSDNGAYNVLDSIEDPTLKTTLLNMFKNVHMPKQYTKLDRIVMDIEFDINKKLNGLNLKLKNIQECIAIKVDLQKDKLQDIKNKTVDAIKLFINTKKDITKIELTLQQIVKSINTEILENSRSLDKFSLNKIILLTNTLDYTNIKNFKIRGVNRNCDVIDLMFIKTANYTYDDKIKELNLKKLQENFDKIRKAFEDRYNNNKKAPTVNSNTSDIQVKTDLDQMTRMTVIQNMITDIEGNVSCDTQVDYFAINTTLSSEHLLELMKDEPCVYDLSQMETIEKINKESDVLEKDKLKQDIIQEDEKLEEEHKSEQEELLNEVENEHEDFVNTIEKDNEIERNNVNEDVIDFREVYEV